MSEIIEKEISIDTLIVTIKAIHVGKKQMTQSVFKQLPMIMFDLEYLYTIQTYNVLGYVDFEYKDIRRWYLLTLNGILYKCYIDRDIRFSEYSDYSFKHTPKEEHAELIRFNKEILPKLINAKNYLNKLEQLFIAV